MKTRNKISTVGAHTPPVVMKPGDRTVKDYLASCKKFFKWTGTTSLVFAETIEDVLSTLKDSRNLFLRSVAE
jgi:hypothetical protein